MFENKAIAFTAAEHMLNALWIITSSEIRSPIAESPESEKAAYRLAISQIVNLIKTEVLSPLAEKHPGLVDLGSITYRPFREEGGPRSR